MGAIWTRVDLVALLKVELPLRCRFTPPRYRVEGDLVLCCRKKRFLCNSSGHATSRDWQYSSNFGAWLDVDDFVLLTQYGLHEGSQKQGNCPYGSRLNHVFRSRDLRSVAVIVYSLQCRIEASVGRGFALALPLLVLQASDLHTISPTFSVAFVRYIVSR